MPTPTAPTATTEVTAFPEAVLLLPKGNPAAIAFCKSILAKTDPKQNADFNPTPTELTTLATDTATYDTANTNARGGGTAATRALKAARQKITKDSAMSVTWFRRSRSRSPPRPTPPRSSWARG